MRFLDIFLVFVLQFQKWPIINFWTGKKFTTAKNEISWKNFLILFDFTSFFAWTFLNFQARCDAACGNIQTMIRDSGHNFKIIFFPIRLVYEYIYCIRRRQLRSFIIDLMSMAHVGKWCGQNKAHRSFIHELWLEWPLAGAMIQKSHVYTDQSFC